jgi:hypothetical protein
MVAFPAGTSMIGFSRPVTQTLDHVAFRDTESACVWLEAQSRQPQHSQAGASAMLPALQAEIDAFNRCALSSRERLKTLEVLRKAVFSVSGDCRRLFAGKPLPLAEDERAALNAARRLWQSHAAGYQRCLQARLEGDSSLSRYGARMAHRFACCLRAEQMTCYAGGMAPRAGFWKSFHTLFLAAERLGCAGESVEDRLLGETRTSSVSGQYAMALMLHLARPFSLSGEQLAAAVRWLARWREQARIVEQADADTGSGVCLIALDLAADGPVHEGGEDRPPRLSRWLSLGSVQRKLRQRREALTAGESPESLKLGGDLSAENCAALLETLADHLQHPLPGVSAVPAEVGGMPKLPVGAGLAAIHRLLGGKGLDEAPPPDGERSGEEKPAVLRQVTRKAPRAQAGPESWRLARREDHEWTLLRLPENGASRLSLHGLIAVKMRGYALALITGLWQDDGGILYCSVHPLAGEAVPRIAEIRNWMTGEVARHPAFQLPANEERARDLLLLPAGVLVRASGVRFLDSDGELLMGLRVADCLERGSEVDFWRAASNR